MAISAASMAKPRSRNRWIVMYISPSSHQPTVIPAGTAQGTPPPWRNIVRAPSGRGVACSSAKLRVPPAHLVGPDIQDRLHRGRPAISPSTYTTRWSWR